MKFLQPVLLLTGLLAAQPAAAQLALSVSDVAAAPAPSAQAAASAPANAVLDIATFLEEKSARLAVSSRTFDPFLMPKDPTEKVEEEPPVEPETDPRQPAFDRAAALAAAAPKLPVTMVTRGAFIMNSRQWKAGEEFIIPTTGGNLEVIIDSIANGRIRLREKESGFVVETGPAAAPAGMNRGTGPALPGGMRRDSPSSNIINLD